MFKRWTSWWHCRKSPPITKAIRRYPLEFMRFYKTFNYDLIQKLLRYLSLDQGGELAGWPLHRAKQLACTVYGICPRIWCYVHCILRWPWVSYSTCGGNIFSKYWKQSLTSFESKILVTFLFLLLPSQRLCTAKCTADTLLACLPVHTVMKCNLATSI